MLLKAVLVGFFSTVKIAVRLKYKASNLTKGRDNVYAMKSKDSRRKLTVPIYQDSLYLILDR